MNENTLHITIKESVWLDLAVATTLFLDSEPEVITSRRREPLRGSRADATIRVPTAQWLKVCSLVPRRRSGTGQHLAEVHARAAYGVGTVFSSERRKRFLKGI